MMTIPTYENGIWTITEFNSREEFRDFVRSVFIDAGPDVGYEFDETSFLFNQEAKKFQKNGYYCNAPIKSKDFVNYWNEQKLKCRNGVIFKNNDKTWYLTRDYYMWLNFLPIYDKEEKRFDFAKVRDAQYHMALYEHLAELNYKHVPILKKRQIASSYFHMAKLINQYWFEEGSVNKIGASLKDYISEKGSWRMLNEYRNFLNEHTAWYRPSEPDKVFSWQQRIKVRTGGRDTYKGNKSIITGTSFEKDPTNGVGGPVSYFFHEEAGIAPKMMDTYEFMRPAMQSGMITTGTFIAAGSVGDLDQCQPLKEMILFPHKYGMQAVTTNLLDGDKTIGETGLFIPEQWSMLPHIDKYGNSLVKEALEAIYEERKQWKKDLSPEQYQLRISQKPTNIDEAFATRKESIFPPHLISHQLKRIQEGEYSVQYIDLYVDENGKITPKTTNKQPIKKFPIDKTMEDKSGAICVYEKPIPNSPWGTYYASIDPVGEGRAEWVGNMVYTPNGKRKIGELKVNDYVIGSDGKKTKVTGVYPQGKKELYRISFNDGFSVLTCKEHLWKVYPNTMDKKDGHVLSVEQMLDVNGIIDSNGIGRNALKKYKTSTYYKNKYGCKWRIPIVEPIVFKDVNLPLDPYFLGLLLGDGGLTTRAIRYASADQELINYISDILPEDISIKKVSAYDHKISACLHRNSITQKLRMLGVMGKGAKDKFIPEIYKIASINDRLRILQGLMDTDGYCGNHGAEFYSISRTLAYDVVDLVHSLGGVARIRKKITNRKVRNGVGFVYIVRVNLPPQFNPFKLTRKSSKYYKPYKFSRYISDISFERIDDAVCISVENKDSLYVTENAIVTHNTTTSDSLCSIFIYKNPTEVIKDEGNGNVKSHFERDGIVASWCGRFDDLQKTHERLELLIEWYNAWTLCENNVSLFIQYMISKRKQKYLVPKDQIPFLKELSSNANVFSTYGWKNTGTLFKTHLISYGIQYLQEEIDAQTDENGEVIKRHYGVERIPDPMLLEEMKQYQPGLNVDRLVSFCALVAFAQIQQNNRGRTTRVEISNDKLENTQKLSKLSVRSPFRHMGMNSNISGLVNKNRSLFKNIK
jgi:hypothetical protein